ncbi:MAG TPA: DUF362 domain-containing protein [Terriglobia bacterium]|nr:DUF362 domain-containing protein [Terriglobia bacterium]
MKRRTFLQLSSAALVGMGNRSSEPSYRIVSAYRPSPHPGMPGPFPGQVVSVRSTKCIDEVKDEVNSAVVREMMDRGMRQLTGESTALRAWQRFISANDVVGIKVNCVGRPKVVSSPEVIAEIVRNLTELGVKPSQICIYDRFAERLYEMNYGLHLPKGVQIHGAEFTRGSIRHYDPATYVEVDFFGEDDTRSEMIAMISKFTKIINVPNMKDHGAAGVTGCLKNIAYGSFSNMDRSHRFRQTHTYSFVGRLAAVEPVRSRTVLQIMDGLRGVWHGGPSALNPRFVFYPKQMMFGTDPVAIDRLMLDVIEAKRKAEGVVSLWDRTVPEGKDRNNPNVSVYIREPGHIEFASTLGLGVADLAKIRVKEIEA